MRYRNRHTVVAGCGGRAEPASTVVSICEGNFTLGGRRLIGCHDIISRRWPIDWRSWNERTNNAGRWKRANFMNRLNLHPRGCVTVSTEYRQTNTPTGEHSMSACTSLRRAQTHLHCFGAVATVYAWRVFKTVKGCVQLFMGNPPQSYGASPAVWDHTVLRATRHRWTRPALTADSTSQPGRMEGWVDLGGWLYTKMVYLSADSNPSRY